MPGVSGRKVADALGISEGAVRKLKTGRLAGAMLADGTFDLARAKALYADVNPAMRREKALPATAAAADSAAESGLSESGPALSPTGSQESKARAILITEKALRERIRRRKDEKSSMDRAPAMTAVETLSRRYRDGDMQFVDKYYMQIAADLGMEDSFRVYEVLDKYKRKHIEKQIDTIKIEIGQ